MKIFNGKPIVDAVEPLVVRVMPKDIKKAVQRNPTCCAVAQSLKRIKDVDTVRVGARIFLVETRNITIRYQLSKEDSKRIRDFDIAGYFRPDSYELMPPKVKLGSRVGKASGTNTRAGKAKTVYNSPALRHALRVSDLEPISA